MNQIKEHKTITMLRSFLRDIPDALYESKSHSLVVQPIDNNGFEVKIEVEHDNYVVSYERWQRKFQNEGEAVFFFMKGLTPTTRLRIESDPQNGVRRTAEHNTDFTWHSEGSKTTLDERAAILGELEIKILQNNLITEPVF